MSWERYGGEKSNILTMSAKRGEARLADKAATDICLINENCSPTPSTQCMFGYS